MHCGGESDLKIGNSINLTYYSWIIDRNTNYTLRRRLPCFHHLYFTTMAPI